MKSLCQLIYISATNSELQSVNAMAKLFDSIFSAGESSSGEFRLAGLDHEYDHFMLGEFPTAPPDLPSAILDDLSTRVHCE